MHISKLPIRRSLLHYHSIVKTTINRQFSRAFKLLKCIPSSDILLNLLERRLSPLLNSKKREPLGPCNYKIVYCIFEMHCKRVLTSSSYAFIASSQGGRPRQCQIVFLTLICNRFVVSFIMYEVITPRLHIILPTASV